MDKYNLCWNEFDNCASATIKTLWSDNAFTDVTLVSDDDKQIQAHKVILGSSSSFFRKILNSNLNKHLFIYLKGIGYSEMNALLRFMYLGQTEVEQENLEKFMNAARELKVRGLHEKLDTIAQVSSMNTTGSIYRNIPAYPEIHKNDDTHLDDQIYVINTEEHIEEDYKGDISRINTVPVEEEPKKHPCIECKYQTNYPHDLRRHKQIKHEGFKPFQCDMCDYRAIQTSDVKKHKMRRHTELAGNILMLK